MSISLQTLLSGQMMQKLIKDLGIENDTPENQLSY